VIVSMPLTFTAPSESVFTVLVVATLLVESMVTRSVTLSPVLVMIDIVEKSRMLMSVYLEMVGEVIVLVLVEKVMSTPVVPSVAVSVVSGFVLIPSFVRLVMVFLSVDIVAIDTMFPVLVLGEVNIVIVVSMP
jgi:hypothetical protein